jgi:hypothetical protein
VSVHCNNENLKAVLGLVLIASSVSNAYVQGQDDYTFNAKGNLRNDLNKGIEGITYNYRNGTKSYLIEKKILFKGKILN